MKRLAVLAAALAAGNALAQAPEVDPDSAQEHRRAVQALPGATVLPVAGASLEIVPVVLEVKGIALGVKGEALGVEGLLRDLNAEVRGREVRIAMSADVLFDFDKADLRKEARPELEKVAAVLKEYPSATARIEGHADGKGDAAYNQKLSERRAAAIRKWLEGEGVKTRLTSKGWGKEKPVAPNVRPDGKDNPEGRQKNRRVEIVLDRQSSTPP